MVTTATPTGTEIAVNYIASADEARAIRREKRLRVLARRIETALKEAKKLTDKVNAGQNGVIFSPSGEAIAKRESYDRAGYEVKAAVVTRLTIH